MQAVIVVEVKGVIPSESRKTFRNRIKQELKEGLVIVDETFTISTHNIQGEIGLEFNEEG